MRIQAKLQLKNYEVLERRKKLGYTLRQLAVSTGLEVQRLGDIENMKVKPRENEAIEIGQVLNCKPSELFPQGYEETVQAINSLELKKINDFELSKVLSSDKNSILMLEANLTINNLTKCLSPQEKDLIEFRNGIGLYKDEGTKTLEECGRKFGVTRERIRQIEAMAHEKMRWTGRQMNIELSSL